jgi:hypothetical protein
LEERWLRESGDISAVARPRHGKFQWLAFDLESSVQRVARVWLLRLRIKDI